MTATFVKLCPRDGVISRKGYFPNIKYCEKTTGNEIVKLKEFMYNNRPRHYFCIENAIRVPHTMNNVNCNEASQI